MHFPIRLDHFDIWWSWISFIAYEILPFGWISYQTEFGDIQSLLFKIRYYQIKCLGSFIWISELIRNYL